MPLIITVLIRNTLNPWINEPLPVMRYQKWIMIGYICHEINMTYILNDISKDYKQNHVKQVKI